MQQPTPGGVITRWRLPLRLAVVVMWMIVLSLLGPPFRWVPKSISMSAFWLFTATAIVGLVFLLFEIGEASRKRTAIGEVVLDALLVLPMFVFWFIAWAASY
jgi:hypothetical protein